RAWRVRRTGRAGRAARHVRHPGGSRHQPGPAPPRRPELLTGSRPPDRPRLPAGAPDRVGQDRAGRLLARGVVRDAVQGPVTSRPGGGVRYDIGPGVNRRGVRGPDVSTERGGARRAAVLADRGVPGERAALRPEVAIREEYLRGVRPAA